MTDLTPSGAGGRVIRPAPHPFLWLLLDLPFGLSSGYIAVALGPFVKKALLLEDPNDAHVMTAVSAIVAATTLPHIIKFLWAPVVDMTLSRKRWYWIGTLVSALAYFGLTLTPIRSGTLSLITWIVIIQSVGAALIGMACEGLLAHATTAKEKGKASGWFQAGNLAGFAVGGGAGLWLATSQPPWVTASVMAALTLVCGLGLGFLDDIRSPSGGHLGGAMRTAVRDVWGLIRSARGVVGIVMFVLPIGTGAVASLFSSVASDWHASDRVVGLVNGWIAAPIMIVGCLVGGWASDKMHRAFAYVAMSLVMVAVTAGMALAPHTEVMYIVFVLTYQLTTGLTFGTYGGFVLAAAGTGAVATKYNVLASFANAPIYYLARLDGWAYDRWSANGMLWFDAALGLAGCLVIAGLIVALGHHRETNEPEAAPEAAAASAGGMLRE